MAEWARLLSECWVKPVAGSNPALPATTKHVRKGVFCFSDARPHSKSISVLSIPHTEGFAAKM